MHFEIKLGYFESSSPPPSFFDYIQPVLTLCGFVTQLLSLLTKPVNYVSTVNILIAPFTDDALSVHILTKPPKNRGK